MKEVIYLDSINSCIILEMFPGNKFDCIEIKHIYRTMIRFGDRDELRLKKKICGRRVSMNFTFNKN
jgi:hypothetical protein